MLSVKSLFLIAVVAVLAIAEKGEEYLEVDDINKCDKEFLRMCALNNYGYPFWYASECLLKYRNYWERTVNTKWDVSKC